MCIPLNYLTGGGGGYSRIADQDAMNMIDKSFRRGTPPRGEASLPECMHDRNLLSVGHSCNVDIHRTAAVMRTGGKSDPARPRSLREGELIPEQVLSPRDRIYGELIQQDSTERDLRNHVASPVS
jgi:hypothetical protein